MLKQTVETITPEKAKEYLKANVSNYRKMSRSVVMKYVEDIKAGRWELNGDTITFDDQGKLKNGQHRLTAIVLAGKPIQTCVVRGVGSDVNIYDVGSQRTVNQIATAEGLDCNATIVAAANIIVNRFSGQGHGSSQKVSYIREHIDELNRAYRVSCYGNGVFTKSSPCVAATYLALRTRAVPVYTAELFFRLINEPYVTKADGYDVTPAMITLKMLQERPKTNAGRQLQKERLEIISLGLRDFNEGVHRNQPYKIAEPFYFMELLDQIRKEDGLTEEE